MIWLLACTSPQQDDRAAYLRSTTADPAAAPALCQAISEDALRADCLIHAAARHAEASDITAAQATCQAIDPGVWQDECWFLTADRAGLIGQTARDACRRSGRFEPHCRGHALGRAVQQVDLPVGEEAAGAVAIGGLVASWRPRSAGMKQRIMANELLATRIGERWADVPFDPALCGQLTPSMCAWAYRASLSQTEADPAALCPGPVTAAAAQAVGLSGWTADGQAVAGSVWEGICAQVSSGQPVDLKPAKLPDDLMPIHANR